MYYLCDHDFRQIPVDVEAIGCDALSATSRKYLRGPRGIGFLYVRSGSVFDRVEPTYLDIHSARWTSISAGTVNVSKDYNSMPGYTVAEGARRYENWERPWCLWLGLGVAAKYALQLGVENIRDRVFELADELRCQLAQVPGVSLHDLGANDTRCGIVTFTVKGMVCNDVVQNLRLQKVNCSASPAYSTLVDMATRGLEDVVRASPHCYNTHEEIGTVVNAVEKLCKGPV